MKLINLSVPEEVHNPFLRSQRDCGKDIGKLHIVTAKNAGDFAMLQTGMIQHVPRSVAERMRGARGYDSMTL